MLSRNSSCISSLFYIKPQLQGVVRLQRPVVYLLFSTSNHNQCPHQSITYWLYIFSFLHQTTTSSLFWICSLSCISSLFYIKPQRPLNVDKAPDCCISSLFYIKPQLMDGIPEHAGVVYLLFSTSNHNPQGRTGFSCVLYIFSFLHQTTTPFIDISKRHTLYIFSFLHQTTTEQYTYMDYPKLYIFSFLHQTTTLTRNGIAQMGCISSLFYIKPQPPAPIIRFLCVVYLLFSTSNHNSPEYLRSQEKVVYLLFSTSNHNVWRTRELNKMLYIFSFLHQTTTAVATRYWSLCCISSLFYIKPQRPTCPLRPAACCISSLFYIKPQLYQGPCKRPAGLYIFSFLHQTTTPHLCAPCGVCCISSLFYIKPQPRGRAITCGQVVYLLFSTSNHNHNHVPGTSSDVVYLLFSTSNHNS